MSEIRINFKNELDLSKRNDQIRRVLKQKKAQEILEGTLHKEGHEDMEYGTDEDLLFADSITIKYK